MTVTCFGSCVYFFVLLSHIKKIQLIFYLLTSIIILQSVTSKNIFCQNMTYCITFTFKNQLVCGENEWDFLLVEEVEE